MSLNRLIFYGAIIGGWAAFVGWMIAEILLAAADKTEWWVVTLISGLVGAAIGGGLSMLAGVANAQWLQMFKRLGPGFLGGLAGGALGGLLGDGIVKLTGGNPIGYIFGWTLLGVAIGAVDGLYSRSPLKLRNGLIGGAIGGFLGGLLFLPFNGIGGLSGRATSFVALGMCIGLFIAIVQVVLKDAWLTVVDGYRPGRQLIITEPETFMGTAEKIALPFIAFGARGVEPRHVRIVRQPDGTYVVMDNNTRSGTKLNSQPLTAPAVLRDGDVIAFGVNMVRFSERRRGAGASAPAPAPASTAITRGFQQPPKP
ncbi:MAG TPA: FHA domain-containing protein, partial [Gemmataceae bacterium]|nr:FHA domain-containing protein [Gemmataceae bacterium]